MTSLLHEAQQEVSRDREMLADSKNRRQNRQDREEGMRSIKDDLVFWLEKLYRWWFYKWGNDKWRMTMLCGGRSWFQFWIF